MVPERVLNPPRNLCYRIGLVSMVRGLNQGIRVENVRIQT